MSAEEFEIETVPGLPQELPPGEELLWQGRPQWKALARHGFKRRWVALYFGVFVVARAVSLATGSPGPDAAAQVVVMSLLFAGCLGVLALVAWLQARTTIYTITTHRVVMRIGAALPMTWNLPFGRLASAELVVRDGGDGDVILQLAPPNRVAWIHLWPHARPGRRLVARPTLRAIAEPQRVAARLEEAVRRWSAREEPEAEVFVDTTVGQDREPTRVPRPLAVTPRLASEGNP